MNRIELNAYEKKDIIEYLKYAKEQKELNRPIIDIFKNKGKFDTTAYDINRIESLIKILESKNERTSLNKNDRSC